MTEINNISNSIDSAIKTRKTFISEMREMSIVDRVKRLKELQEAIDYLTEFKIRLIEEKRINDAKTKKDSKIPFMRTIID